KPIREHTSAEHSEQRRRLEERGGVKGGISEIEGEFFVEKIWQPAVEQPEAEDKCGKHHAQQHESGGLDEFARCQIPARDLRVDCRVLLHRTKEKKAGESRK